MESKYDVYERHIVGPSAEEQVTGITYMKDVGGSGGVQSESLELEVAIGNGNSEQKGVNTMAMTICIGQKKAEVMTTYETYCLLSILLSVWVPGNSSNWSNMPLESLGVPKTIFVKFSHNVTILFFFL